MPRIIVSHTVHEFENPNYTSFYCSSSGSETEMFKHEECAAVQQSVEYTPELDIFAHVEIQPILSVDLGYKADDESEWSEDDEEVMDRLSFTVSQQSSDTSAMTTRSTKAITKRLPIRKVL
jgi:hypothetical protein